MKLRLQKAMWGLHQQIKELRAEEYRKRELLENLRYSLLSRIHDDGEPRELFAIELKLIEELLGTQKET